MIPVANYIHCYARAVEIVQIYFRKHARLLVKQRLARSIVCDCTALRLDFAHTLRRVAVLGVACYFFLPQWIFEYLRARGFVSRRKSRIRQGGSGWNNPLVASYSVDRASRRRGACFQASNACGSAVDASSFLAPSFCRRNFARVASFVDLRCSTGCNFSDGKQFRYGDCGKFDRRKNNTENVMEIKICLLIKRICYFVRQIFIKFLVARFWIHVYLPCNGITCINLKVHFF